MKKQNPEIKVPNFKIRLSQSDINFILEKTRTILRLSRWTSGPVAVEFEEAFKKYVSAPYAISVSNGGAALLTIIQALHIPKDSIIICPTLTAPPTPHAILLSGMRVVFADSSLDDLSIDLEDVENKLKKYHNRVKAVITVHLGGWISPRIGLLKKLCEKHGVLLIEDCAHAHGSFLNGKHAGSFSKAAAYSFFMTKSLTCGEGGIVTSDDKNLIDEIKVIRNYGKDDKGIHVINGFNYKFSEFNAAVSLWAAINAPRLIAERRKIASNYDNLLRDVKDISVFNIPECQCGYYKYIIMLKKGINRDKFREILLHKYGIELAGGIYDLLCHQEPYFRSIPEKVKNADDNFIYAEDFSKRQVCLPLYPCLRKKEQIYIAKCIDSVLKKLDRK